MPKIIEINGEMFQVGDGVKYFCIANGEGFDKYDITVSPPLFVGQIAKE